MEKNCPLVIYKIDQFEHFGLKASKEIKKGTLIGFYGGEIKTAC